MQTAARSLYLCRGAAIKPKIGIIYFIYTWTSENKGPLGLNMPMND